MMIGKIRSTLFVAAMGLALSVGGAVTQVSQVQADSFDINTCWSSCDGPLPNVTVATLDITPSGANVAFALTNSVSNLGAFANAGTFISNLHFTYTGPVGNLANTDFSVVPNGSFTTGPPGPGTTFPPVNSFTDAALSFNLNLGLPTANTPARFTDGEVINWTVSNAVVTDFTSSLNQGGQFLMVHVQSLVSGGSTKYVDGPTNNIPVPEPASLLLLGAGLAGIGIWRRVSGKTKA